jgi:hypothetical protein
VYDFGESIAAEVLLQSNVGKMSLLKYFVSSSSSSFRQVPGHMPQMHRSL